MSTWHHLNRSDEIRARARRRRRVTGGLTALVIALVVVLGGCYGVAYKNSERTIVVTITDKERVCDSSTSDSGQSCKYLIFTDKGTYEITDGFFVWRWDSSDVYGRLRRDRTYELRVIGFRLPWSSSYPNVKDIVEERGR